MKKLISVLLFITIVIVSCKHYLPNFTYVSSDNVTGGFNEFILKLDSLGFVELSINSSELAGETDAGSIWNGRQFTANGWWYLDKNKIRIQFQKSKNSIDSIFKGTEWEHLIDKPLIEFSENNDTAYIYGFPCLLQTH